VLHLNLGCHAFLLRKYYFELDHSTHICINITIPMVVGEVDKLWFFAQESKPEAHKVYYKC
jgi:hypothetical protein